MDPATIVLVAIALAMDCFAVALAAGITGTGGHRAQGAVRIALAFGAFQAGMPVLGWLAGEAVLGYIMAFGHWIAFLLLAVVGARMIQEGVSGGEKKAVRLDTASLLVLSVATSIDALAVGVSFALLGITIIIPCLVFGLFTFGISFTGAILGGIASERWGRTTEVLGGLVLITIGIQIVVSHLAG